MLGTGTLKPGQRPGQGVAALTVVMVLFFVMALVAAYTNRNLIFEQRISANSYRAERALNAADAAVDWTLALLNGGRIDNRCQASTNLADKDFRRRYLIDTNDPVNGDGGYTPVAGLFPACLHPTGLLSPAPQPLTCICPDAQAPVPAMPLPADGIASGFRVWFQPPGNTAYGIRPGTLVFVTRGCASPGSGNSACFAQNTNTPPSVDAAAGVIATVGLMRALPWPQQTTAAVTAALIAGGTVTANPAGVIAENAPGPAVRSGGAITGVVATPAASPADTTLLKLSTAANDVWFKTLFGMEKASYQRQPATIVLDCRTGCTSTDLNSTLAGFPRNPIWVNGNLTIDASTIPPLGGVPPAQDPLLLIVNGLLTVSANAPIVGFVYATSIVLTAAAGSAPTTPPSPPLLMGAMVSETQFSAATTAALPATLQYDANVLNFISLRYGSFVKVPGGWNLTDR